jgi:hypothetical protein
VGQGGHGKSRGLYIFFSIENETEISWELVLFSCTSQNTG